MADRKISDLTALTTPATGDLIPIVDISEAAAADKNKSITVGELLRGAPDGTAAAPGIAFESDGGNGMFLGGTDILAFSTGGTQAVTIDASQRVGIGTTSPAARLHVSQGASSVTPNANADELFIENNGNTGITLGSPNTGNCRITFGDPEDAQAGLIFYDHATNHLRFDTAATERVRIDSSGNVGIGTTSPSTQLEVVGGINATDNTVTMRTVPAGTVGYFGTTTNHPLGFRIQDSEKARIDTSGRLLVGTSISVLEKLVVKGDGGGIQINRNDSGSPTSGQALGSIGFKGIVSANSNAAAEVLIQAAADENHSGSTAGSRLEFHTKPSGIGPGSSPTERFRLSQDGRPLFFSAVDAMRIATATSAGTSAAFIYGTYGGSSNTSPGTVSFIVYTNGNVVNTNNSYGAISDVKLKENIVDASSQWDDLKAIQVRNYNFKEGQTHTQIGVVAQEVELVSPGLVTEAPDRDEEGNDLGTTTKSVNYSVLYMKAVKALQEAMERIETLEAKVAALEAN